MFDWEAKKVTCKDLGISNGRCSKIKPIHDTGNKVSSEHLDWNNKNTMDFSVDY